MTTSPLIRRSFATGAELAPAFAEWSADILAKAISSRGAALLAVSGGSTPLRYFQALSTQKIDWSRISITLVDERRVADDSPRSNARLVRDALLKNLALPATFVPLADSRLTPEQELSSACARIATLPLPADLVVLGMGEDGHTASWFPGADGLAEAMDPAARALVAVLAPQGLESRLTLTGRVVLRARQIALQIEGPKKEETLRRALEEGPTDAMPIRAALRQAADKLTIFEALAS
jgi:6-phosphogluconolactonase